MRTLVLGGDGYLGWPTAMHLASAGHEVVVVDNFLRRYMLMELGSNSLTPIASLPERMRVFKEVTGKEIHSRVGNLTDAGFVDSVFKEFRPGTVIHYGEQPSAPYSM